MRIKGRTRNLREDVYKRQGEIETLNLETGDIADYRTTAQGIELEVMDAEEKRLAMLYFR